MVLTSGSKQLIVIAGSSNECLPPELVSTYVLSLPEGIVMKFKKGLVFTLVLAFSPFPVVGQEVVQGAYYVSPSGSDSNDGLLVEEGGTGPWRTIQHAAQTVIAGDTVYVREGVYTEPDPIEGSTQTWGIRPANDGAPELPVTYSGYPGENAVVDMKGQAPCFALYGRKYITVTGFELKNCWQAGVWAMSGSGRENGYITVSNNVIHHIDGGVGQNVAGVRIDDAGYSTITDNLIYNIRVGGVHNANAAGVLSYGMYEVNIQNNEIYDVYSGIFHKIPDAIGRKGGVFQRNRIHDVELGFYFNSNEAMPESGIHYNTEIRNNIVYDATAFVYETTEQSVGQNRGLKIYNNTVVGADISIRGFADVELKDNIFYSFTGLKTIYQQEALTRDDRKYPSIAISDYNIFYPDFVGAVGVYSGNEVRANSLSDWQKIGYEGNPLTMNVAAPGPDQNSKTDDPLFVDAGQNDYHLANGSPAIGMAADGSSVGAYKFGNEVIGVRSELPSAVARPLPPKLFVE